MMNLAINISGCEEQIREMKKWKAKKRAAELISEKKEYIQSAKKLLANEKSFDSLGYPEKLKFWDTNDLHPFIWSYAVAKNEKDNAKIFSIHPENAEERKYYFDWNIPYQKKQSPLLYDLDAMKENYFSKITDNPQPLEYTVKELTKYKTERGRYMIQHRDENSTFRVNYHNKMNPFKEGYDSVVDKRELDYEDKLLAFIDVGLIQRGIVSAHFISFLEQQKIRLEHELRNPKLENINLITKIKWKKSPATLGWIFLKLAEAGYIDIPETHGEGSYKKLAREVLNHFTVKGSDEYITSQFNPSRNALSEPNRAKIQVTEIS